MLREIPWQTWINKFHIKSFPREESCHCCILWLKRKKKEFFSFCISLYNAPLHHKQVLREVSWQTKVNKFHIKSLPGGEILWLPMVEEKQKWEALTPFLIYCFIQHHPGIKRSSRAEKVGQSHKTFIIRKKLCQYFVQVGKK